MFEYENNSNGEITCPMHGVILCILLAIHNVYGHW